MEITTLLHFGTLIFFTLILAKSGDVTIEAASRLSKSSGISHLTIGFLLLSVLTSLPELAVSALASTSQNIGIAIGNIFGSNIANIGLIVGLAAMIIKDIEIKKELIANLSEVLFATSLLPLVLIYFAEISQLFGVLLLLIFAAYVYVITRRHRSPIESGKLTESKSQMGRDVLWLVAGVFAVLISSQFVVESASSLASILGIAQTVIGATIIAVGTSLPELVVMLSALKQKHIELALGNAVGSCMANSTLVLGFALIFSPLIVNFAVFTQLIIFNLAMNLSLWFFLSRGRLGKSEGIFFFVLYAVFLLVTFGTQLLPR